VVQSESPEQGDESQALPPIPQLVHNLLKQVPEAHSVSSEQDA